MNQIEATLPLYTTGFPSLRRSCGLAGRVDFETTSDMIRRCSKLQGTLYLRNGNAPETRFNETEDAEQH